MGAVEDYWPALADMDLEQVGKVSPPAAIDHCSDLANAHRIAKHFGERLLYVTGIGWHVWGPPWRHDEGAAAEVVHGLGRIISEEAQALEWSDGDRETLHKQAERLRKWARQSESALVMRNAMDVASSILRANASDMDADPNLLGVANGVIDLRTMAFREYLPDDRITKKCTATYDPSQGCDQWLQFLGDIVPDDDVLRFLQVLSGYVVTGNRGESVLPILYGGGANGKSTFLAALQHVMGDYSGTAPQGLLMRTRGDSHPTGLASLHGKRLVVSSETGEGGRLNEEQVKSITGNDRIVARRMHKDYFEFDPSHQIILATNHRPKVMGTDDGIWRRIRLIPFGVQVPPEKRDPLLGDKLKAEGSGILNWCLAGLRVYRAEGLRTPKSVATATAQYRSLSDKVGTFLDEYTEPDSNGLVPFKLLYATYASWCDESGERIESQRDFNERVRNHADGEKRHKTLGMQWVGLRMKAPAHEAYEKARNGW